LSGSLRLSRRECLGKFESLPTRPIVDRTLLSAHRRTHTPQAALALTHIYEIIRTFSLHQKSETPRPVHQTIISHCQLLCKERPSSDKGTAAHPSLCDACRQSRPTRDIGVAGKAFVLLNAAPPSLSAPGHPPVQLLRTPHLVLAGPRKAALARNSRFRRSSSASSTLCSVIGRVFSLGRLPESPPETSVLQRDSACISGRRIVDGTSTPRQPSPYRATQHCETSACRPVTCLVQCPLPQSSALPQFLAVAPRHSSLDPPNFA
jgi:hypothetical protein